MQITEKPVPRRRLKKDNWLMSSVIRGMNVENRIQKKAYPHQPTPVSMSTKQESLNVLTAKVRSVSPWGSRFNLGSQGLTTFHMWWSRFPTLDGDISQWHAWGPISFLETAQIFWSHVAYQQYHGSSYKVMSRTPKWGRHWATGRFGLQLVEYKECQK